MSTDIAKLRSQVGFLVPETIPGVLVYPTSSSLKLLPLDLIAMDQETPKSIGPEIIGDTRDVFTLCNNNTPAGSWSLGVLSHPAGAGVVPHEKPLMLAAFGKETIVASTSVSYDTLVDKQSYSLWRKSGHTVYHATGCTCNTYTESLGDECELRLNFEGQFMSMGWAGRSSVTSVTGTLISLPNTERFTVGAKVELVDNVGNVEDNSGAGFIIVSKVDGVSLTVSPTIPAATYVTVQGFIPTGVSASTAALPSRPATVTVGTYTAKVRNLSVSFTDNISYPEDEINGVGYPSFYTEGQRDVSGSMTMYFREDDTDFHEWAKQNTTKVLTIDMGGSSGVNRVTELLDIRFTKVSISNDDPSLGIQVEFMAKGTAGEDAISVVYE